MKLTFKQEKWEDGFHYEYHVDELDRKQGTVTVFHPDINGDKSTKIHAVVNFIDNKYEDNVYAYDENGLCYLEYSFKKSKLHGKAILTNDEGKQKIMIMKNGERVDNIKNISQ